MPEQKQSMNTVLVIACVKIDAAQLAVMPAEQAKAVIEGVGLIVATLAQPKEMEGR